MEKVGRNDPCPCGSGKKFKKCCESKATKRSIGNAQVITGPNKMASLFQRHVTVQKPAEEVPQDDKHLNM
jgi:hypothetical protein